MKMQRKKLENIAEGWKGMRCFIFRWTVANGTGDRLEGQNNLIKSANARVNAT